MVVSTWTPDWVVQVQAQVGVVALCVKAGGGGVTLQWTSIPFSGGGGVEILLVNACYRNLVELLLYGPLS